MRTARVIPCLDVDAGRVVKGVNFVDLRDAGDPVELAARYDAEGADELVFLDITASSDDRDTIVDGHLVIDAEVEVSQAGRFHLEATLYNRDGSRGLAEAHTASELPPGRHWLRLTFFGRILNQGGVDGPYLLRFVALTTATRMPNAKNRLVENAHLTAPFRAAQFSDAPFDDPDLLDAADRLDASTQ